MDTRLKTTWERVQLALARSKNREANGIDPLVSVRIPTKNRGKLLIERAIASVLKQTYKKIEIIVVGDDCTDDTRELLSQVRHPRLYFFNLPPRSQAEQEFLKDPEMRWFTGPVRPTNKANELVSGEWIAHIDDDDIWTDDHIESLLWFAIDNNYEFASADYIAEKYGEKKTVSDGGQTWLYRSYLKLFKYDQNCWKKKWNRVSDLDVWERMKSAGVRMGHLNKVVAYVLPRPGEETIGLDAYKKYDAIH